MFKLNICYLFSFSLALEPLLKSKQDLDLPHDWKRISCFVFDDFLVKKKNIKSELLDISVNVSFKIPHASNRW